MGHKHLWTPLLPPYLLSPSMHLWLHGEFPMTVDRGREDAGLVYRWFYMKCRQHLEVNSLQHYSHFLGHPWRTGVEGNIPSRRQNFKQCPWLFTSFGKRNGQICNSILIHKLWLMVWLDDQALKRKMIAKLVTRMWINFSEFEKKYWRPLCPMWTLNKE